MALASVLIALPGCSSLKERLALANGNKLYKAQKYERAIEEYKKILASSPDHWDANYMTAVSYLALYHPGSTHPKDVEYAENAIQAFEKVLKLNPPDQATRDKVRGYYVGLLTQTGKMDKAVEFFETLVQEDPKNLDYLTNAAQMQAKAGNFDKAMEYFLRRADLEPKNVEAWYTVGAVCWERSYRQGALMSTAERDAIVTRGMEALEKALTIDPEHTPSLAYMNLLWREKGKVLVELNQVAEAGQAILKADEYQKKALAIMNRKRKEAATAEAQQPKQAS